jgi:hypothetical protein
VDRGADLHEKTPEGLTALDFARRLGHTAVVDALVKAGATSGSAEPVPTLTFVRANSVRDAVQRSLPLLQRTSLEFSRKSGCASSPVLPPGRALSLEDAARRRIVVREDPRPSNADLLRKRFSARPQPVHLGGRDELGDAGPHPGRHATRTP